MKIIIPIGGGEISTQSTISIDKYILNLVNKEEKKVLFIPLASGDNIDYSNRFKQYYESLGCIVDILYLSKTDNDNLIRSKVFSSDIIYIGGGNTAKMMRVFKRSNIISYLKDAYLKGIILTGLSAGAMAYFTKGYSDSNKFNNPNASYCEVKGLDLIPYYFCPHYNEEDRKSFDEYIKNKKDKGLALEDNTALIFINDEIKGVINSGNVGKGYFIDENSKEEIKQCNH